MKKKESFKRSTSELKNISSRAHSNRITPLHSVKNTPLHSRETSETKIGSLKKILTTGVTANVMYNDAFQDRLKRDNRKALEDSIIKTGYQNLIQINDTLDVDKKDQQITLDIQLQNKKLEEMKTFLDDIQGLYPDFPKDYLKVRKSIMGTHKNKSKNQIPSCPISKNQIIFHELQAKRQQAINKLDQVNRKKEELSKNLSELQETENSSVSNDRIRKFEYQKMRKGILENEYNHNKDLYNKQQELFIKLQETPKRSEVNDRMEKVNETLEKYLINQTKLKINTGERVLQNKKLNTNEQIYKQEKSNKDMDFMIKDLKNCIDNGANSNKIPSLEISKHNSGKKRPQNEKSVRSVLSSSNKENTLITN